MSASVLEREVLYHWGCAHSYRLVEDGLLDFHFWSVGEVS